MKLSELCSCLKEHPSYDFVEKDVWGITHNSQKIKGSYVFVAIKGHKLDGHDFIVDAMARDAAALVVGKRIEIT
ncbi:MAG: UDP-N-acetylmuramoyl-L-alanyl-D-glutamate--2,6-diaminopimelate ligase, partial [Planctomycetes bacterium]|nr:UDP-N-acetylmuramoyl-L-alanyl-D-glutamate--2,6-diaminopimelate ligase [Planctomycetota bacterium]